MPELPEVETIVRQLRPLLSGQVISDLKTHWPPTVSLDPDQVAALKGRRIDRVERRGKWILFVFPDRSGLAIHLRMSGRLSCEFLPGREKHLRAELSFAGGQRLYFYDPRKFGRIRSFSGPDAPWLQLMGVEPFNDQKLEAALADCTSRRAVKTVLLDQSIVAGVGNIYADEALFSARIHPLTPFCSLTAAQRNRLAQAIRVILDRAIASGGSTVADYRNLAGVTGFFQQEHQVYQRAGQPCRICGSPIERLRIGGRSSHFCPKCQPPRLD